MLPVVTTRIGGVQNTHWSNELLVLSRIGHYAGIFSNGLFRPRPKTGLKAGECGTYKVCPASDIFGALAVCDEHRAEEIGVAHQG